MAIPSLLKIFLFGLRTACVSQEGEARRLKLRAAEIQEERLEVRYLGQREHRIVTWPKARDVWNHLSHSRGG